MKRKRDMIDFTDDIIRVQCGGSTKLTHIHRSLLEKMLGPLEVFKLVWGEFDPITNKLDLSTDAQHDGFQLIAQWLYTGEIGLADEASGPVTALNVLVNAYHAADRLCFDRTALYWSSAVNAIMDHLVDRVINPEKYGAAITVEDLLKIPRIPDTEPSHFFRDWLVYGDLTSILRPEQLDHLFDDRSTGSCLRDVLEQRLGGTGTTPWEKNPCEYHLHMKGSKQCQARASTARTLTDTSTKSGQVD
ncbi:hypothetical protein D0869_15113 [Hortaea werneckii]|uniref:BTB domain-containing protein n=1 Tax=Hortaea werneckii TaxID=91943 RepID=A0A3M6W0C5_HORWE|nr:hypothetical protein KC324_g9214 [Hortaea werneckii]KAI7583380.1 hypothetical protein KC316_g7323 [Hortaea werneckii]RMX71949.1 hypothetical protein D0869_15113 [Hortaea werneckii]RMX83373.1 hypothetical protein D0868_15671 [Hortaea werneckii]